MPVTIWGDGIFPTTATSNVNGTFRFSNPPAGEFNLVLGGQGARLEQRTILAGGPDDVVSNFTLTSAFLSGSVLAADGLTLVRGALIELVRDGQPVTRAFSDGAGRYRLAVVATGEFDLVVSHPQVGIQQVNGLAVSAGAMLEQDIVPHQAIWR